MARKRWTQGRRSVRRPVKPHAEPGSIAVDPLAPAGQLNVIAYSPTAIHEVCLHSVAEIAPLRKQWPVVWIDVGGLGSAEIIQQIGHEFQLHPLALEDVVNTHQRAKFDSYGDVLFYVSRMIGGPPLQTEQISFFLGRGFLVTFQEDQEGDSLEPVRERIRKSRGRIRKAGADYLMYELIDAVLEGYFPVLERYGTQLDELDHSIQNNESVKRQSEIHALRGELQFLRRLIWPHRDAVQALLREGDGLIHDETRLYLRDTSDHVMQLVDIVEIYRESCNDLRDYHYAKVGNRTNEIMRTLTIIATIFMPLSFVAGVYGMNFDVMPELHWLYGYPMAIAIMLLIAAGFLVFFWRRGWLHSSESL